MDEENIPNEVPLEVPAEPVDLIAKASQAAERMELANNKYEELVKRQEALRVEETLGGSSSAGETRISDEDKKNAEAKKFLKGTGFEDSLFPDV